MDDQYDESSSENWDWEEAKYVPPKPLTARERFEQVLSNQKNRFAEPFTENPLYEVTKPLPPTPPPRPAPIVPPAPQFDEKFNFDDDYAKWVPYEPPYESTVSESYSDSSYEVLSETEESDWDITESCEEPAVTVDESRLIQELKNLNANLTKVEERCNIIATEKDMLLSQLEDCEDLYERLLDEVDQLEDAIEEKEDEIDAYNSEVHKMQIAQARYEMENKLMSQIIGDIDEFSQSTQLLLNNALYFDMEDLIMKHIKKCDSSDPVKVKKSIIAEANVIRKEQLKSAVQALDCYLVDHPTTGAALNFKLIN